MLKRLFAISFVVALLCVAAVDDYRLITSAWLAKADTLVVPESYWNRTLSSSDVEVIAEELFIPWEIAWLPSGEMLVTERRGTLVLFNKDQPNRLKVSDVTAVGEGGLLGLAVDPEFKSNNRIYLYHTVKEQAKVYNRVVSYRLNRERNRLEDQKVVVNHIPGARYHNGGRIAFGPDGLLYVTTGDAGEPSLSQDTNSLAGKILRIDKTGTIPEGNKYNNLVYSLGHRNPQGLAWDTNGGLWSTEHGPSGTSSGWDEINFIQSGGNYGWPRIKGAERRGKLLSPAVYSGAEETWAPSGIAFWNNMLFFAGLRGEALYVVRINYPLSQPKKYLHESLGRLRAVAYHSDGYLYFSTSNRDGRSFPTPGDDKIVRVKLDDIEG